MLAGTITAKVLKICSTTGQPQWKKSYRGHVGVLLLSSPKYLISPKSYTVMALTGNQTSHLQDTAQFWVLLTTFLCVIEKGNFIFIRLLFKPNFSCASYAGNFCVNIELAQNICCSTQRQLRSGRRGGVLEIWNHRQEEIISVQYITSAPSKVSKDKGNTTLYLHACKPFHTIHTHTSAHID